MLLTRLRNLELQGNALTGNIAPELGNLADLYYLDLRDNLFTGPIPDELAELPLLQALYLGGNSLTGCIPERLLPAADSPHIVRWHADEEPLPYCGAAPTPLPTPNPNLPPETLALIALYDATNGPNWKTNTNWRTDAPISTWHGVQTDAQGRVTHLDLNDNNLSGHIPEAIGQLDSLRLLYLFGNNLTGTIPDEIGELTNLKDLDLSDNELSGAIPPQFGNLKKLTQLGLAYNELSGPIPPELGSMSMMASMSLQGNQLTGKIPTELTQLQELYGLDIAGNELQGTIPKAFAQLGRLVYLDFSNNNLSGDISEWPANLKSLTQPRLGQLRISDNDFTGCIPTQLREITDTDFIYSKLNHCGEPPKQPPVSPDFVQWIIGEGVSPSEERAARLGLQWLYQYGLSQGWPIAGETITIHLDDLHGLAQTLANQDGNIEPGEIQDNIEFIKTVGGFAEGDINYNRASSPGDPVLHHITANTVTHENLHIMFQIDLTGLNSTRHDDWTGPHWWNEGMAKLITEIAVQTGTSFAERRRFIVETSAADRCNAPLAQYEITQTYDLFVCGYDVGALAVELLGSKVGFRNIVKVYTDRQPGWTWQQTFEHVFDITLQDFYTQFALHRQAGFPAVPHPITAPTP